MRGDLGSCAPAGRLGAPFVLSPGPPARVATSLAGNEASRRPGLAPQPTVMRKSKSQRVTTTAKVSSNGSPRRKVVATDQTGLPMRRSASAPPSFNVKSDNESFGVASLGACTLELGGEEGGSAVPGELESELESDLGSGAEAGAGEVFVAESALAPEGAVAEASGGEVEAPVAVTS